MGRGYSIGMYFWVGCIVLAYIFGSVIYFWYTVLLGMFLDHSSYYLSWISRILLQFQRPLDIPFEKPQVLIYRFLIVMFFVIKKPIFLLSIAFKGLLNQGGCLGIILLISFGTKFDRMFKTMSVNVFACQLTSE